MPCEHVIVITERWEGACSYAVCCKERNALPLSFAANPARVCALQARYKYNDHDGWGGGACNYAVCCKQRNALPQIAAMPARLHPACTSHYETCGKLQFELRITQRRCLQHEAQALTAQKSPPFAVRANKFQQRTADVCMRLHASSFLKQNTRGKHTAGLRATREQEATSLKRRSAGACMCLHASQC